MISYCRLILTFIACISFVFLLTSLFEKYNAYYTVYIIICDYSRLVVFGYILIFLKEHKKNTKMSVIIQPTVKHTASVNIFKLNLIF
jgi:hypothetical protein